MNLRTRPDIDIKRGGDTIATVPITPACRRSVKLMEADNITLDFLWPVPLRLRVGDYVDDELFGRFYLDKATMPAYDKATGGYRHQLTLVAPYMMWRNRLAMMVTNVSGAEIKEASWSLTANLSTHAEQVVANAPTYYYSSVTVAVDIATVTEAAAAKCLTYNATDIITALNMIAEAWQCEWWVSESSGVATVHFGKCESGDPLTFRLGYNVESMDVADNTNVYANRVYAFGSDRNIPKGYRRSLEFTVNAESDGYFKAVGNGGRKISQDFFFGTGRTTEATNNIGFNETPTTDHDHGVSALFISEQSFAVSPDTILNSDSVRILLTTPATIIFATVTVTVELVANNVSRTLFSWSGTKNMTRAGGYPVDINVTDYAPDFTGDAANLYLRVVTTECEDNEGNQITGRAAAEKVTAALADTLNVFRLTTETTRKATTIYYNGEHTVLFNPSRAVQSSSDYDKFQFITSEEDWTAASAPADFGVGSVFTLVSPDYSEIPNEYYSGYDYQDPSSLAKLGERRLRMPDGDYIDKGVASEAERVEQVVLFNDIYPHCVLTVTGIETADKKTSEEDEDGSKVYWAWKQYILTAAQVGGAEFKFNTKYITDGQKLRVRFMTPAEANATLPDGDSDPNAIASDQPCLLAGMEFEVQFLNKEQTYTLVRNEDYGARLPNDTLKPTVGDPFVLVNWNAQAIGELGLVAAAEQRLKEKAQAYVDAIEEGQFVFTCHLMSDVPFELEGDFRLRDSDNKAFNADDPDYSAPEDGRVAVFVRNDGTRYALPALGHKVTIAHDALRGGALRLKEHSGEFVNDLDDKAVYVDREHTKTSRIIGYELKLDLPFDTPTYTVGETDAYSRLRKIEKEITKLS